MIYFTPELYTFYSYGINYETRYYYHFDESIDVWYYLIYENGRIIRSHEFDKFLRLRYDDHDKIDYDPSNKICHEFFQFVFRFEGL